MSRICLVGCVQRKLPHPAPARDLYVSTLFEKSRTIAEKKFDRWYVLSAEYGLVAPNTVIDTYDKTLNVMPKGERIEWTLHVYRDLQLVLAPGDEITFFAGARYREELIPLLKGVGYAVNVPMAGMRIGEQLHFLTNQLSDDPREADVNRLYSLLDVLREGLNGGRKLGECTGKLAWPERGVYFFFEPGEYRKNDAETPRVIRVGTHGVSRGSGTMLWQRLSNHRGTKSGTGNHRGSVFRKHIGKALLQRDQQFETPNWGRGNSASKEIREQEEPLERAVSEYLEAMSLLWLAIEDEPGPASDRAYIERNCIGLLAGDAKPADPPGNQWPGNFSELKAIRTSGLWNINHTEHNYDPQFLNVLEQYVEITLDRRQKPDTPLAPPEWHAGSKTA